MNLVVDTWVICKASDARDSLFMPANSLLHRLTSTPHRLVLDAEGFIQAQYAPYIQATAHLPAWWDVILYNAGNMYTSSGKCTNAQRRALLDDLQFHHKDLAFVGAAIRSNAVLVAEESDYTGDVKAYLQTLGVAVIGILDALDLI